MGAREQLNAVVVWGCLVGSSLLGLVMQSWVAFWGTLLITLAASYNAEGIRTGPAARRPAGGRGGRRATSRGRRP